MQAALLGNHDRSIHVLMSQWALNDLVLSQMVPNVFTSLLPLYVQKYQTDLVRQGEFTSFNLHIRLMNDSKVFELFLPLYVDSNYTLGVLVHENHQSNDNDL